MTAIGISPNIAVGAGAGYFSLSSLFWSLVLPGFAIFLSILFYARFKGMDRLYRRLWVTFIGGIALTVALDIFR